MYKKIQFFRGCIKWSINYACIKPDLGTQELCIGIQIFNIHNGRVSKDLGQNLVSYMRKTQITTNCRQISHRRTDSISHGTFRSIIGTQEILCETSQCILCLHQIISVSISSRLSGLQSKVLLS